LELLRVGGADGNDHSSAVGELRGQRGGDTESRSGDEDGVERGAGSESKGSVTGEHADVGIAEGGENAAGALREGCVAFDGEDLRGKFREQSGNVAGTGANFENLFGRRELEGLEHEGNDIGLRDGLAVSDGKRMIFVGLGAVRFRDKFVAGDAKHGVEDARVGNPTGPELGVDHKLTSGGRVGHAIPASGARLPAVSDEESRAISNSLSYFYFLRRRICTSKLTTPFWSRLPTREMLRLT
jgi:hypothetical protein